MSVDAVLEIRGLGKQFGGFRAVDGVDLTVARGSIHSVIGPNGAGKTTFFRLLTGILRPSHGQILFEGKGIGGLRPHQITRRGVSQSFQITNVFATMSVLESVETAVLARRRRTWDFVTTRRSEVSREAIDLLEQVGLADRSGVRADTLSHGDQRVLELTLALATRPRALLLDEPTAGMSPFETDRMVDLVTRLAREQHLTVLLSEHDMDVVFGISDEVTVLHQGRVIAQGPPEAVESDEQVMDVYLGGMDE